MLKMNRARWCVVAVAIAALTAGCGSSKSGGKGGASSGSKGAVGSGSAGMPNGGGGGASVGSGNSGCVEDDALSCSNSTGITCWGNVYPDPSQWNCSYGVCETSDCQTYDSGDFEGYCCN